MYGRGFPMVAIILFRLRLIPTDRRKRTRILSVFCLFGSVVGAASALVYANLASAPNRLTYLLHVARVFPTNIFCITIHSYLDCTNKAKIHVGHHTK